MAIIICVTWSSLSLWFRWWIISSWFSLLRARKIVMRYSSEDLSFHPSIEPSHMQDDNHEYRIEAPITDHLNHKFPRPISLKSLQQNVISNSTTVAEHRKLFLDKPNCVDVCILLTVWILSKLCYVGSCNKNVNSGLEGQQFRKWNRGWFLMWTVTQIISKWQIVTLV
jgi:hypothetical protein